MNFAEPKTYEQLFKNIDEVQVVLVSGEQDNTFTPGGGGPAMPWSGITETGSVARNATKTFATPVLEAGTYQFAMTGSGGDADLYVRNGHKPTKSEWDYRPYLIGNNETVIIDSPKTGTYYILLRGYAAYAGVTLQACFMETKPEPHEE